MKRIRNFLFLFTCMYLAVDSFGATNEMSQPSFGLDRIQDLQQTWGGYPLWQYCASLLWVVLAFILMPIIDFVMTRVVKRLTSKTRTDLDDKLLTLLRWPLKILVMITVLNTGIQTFAWPNWMERIESVVFIIALGVTVLYIAVQFVELLLVYLEERFFGGDAHLAKLMLPVLGKALKVFVIIIGALTIAQHLGLQIASVITGLGIGGVAVALAAQSTLANLFGSLVILGDQPFHAGDRIEIDKYNGIVESIGLRSTRLRTAEGNLVTIPNKTVADSAILNFTMRPRPPHAPPRT